jgi:hypothetical protein
MSPILQEKSSDSKGRKELFGYIQTNECNLRVRVFCFKKLMQVSFIIQIFDNAPPPLSIDVLLSTA